VVRTRVGYAGGPEPAPSYHNIGGHSETIQVDYDPELISYEELLEVFWTSHSPTTRPWSQQYASIIFYHDEEQRRLAEESRELQVTRRRREIYTEVVSYSSFHLAEFYHQKYRLQQIPELMNEFVALFPNERDFINSTAVARVNAYVGGHGTMEELETQIENLGLSPAGKAKLREIVAR
jgi:peptide-methionine (S)-S-oxide reductase